MPNISCRIIVEQIISRRIILINIYLNIFKFLEELHSTGKILINFVFLLTSPFQFPKPISPQMNFQNFIGGFKYT